MLTLSIYSTSLLKPIVFAKHAYFLEKCDFLFEGLYTLTYVKFG